MTNDLWVADVGQNRWEEITASARHQRLGPLRPTSGGDCEVGASTFAGDRPENNIDPVFVYPHGDGVPSGCSITGGEVYRGSAIPDLFGAYVFGDYCTSRIWAISVRSG